MCSQVKEVYRQYAVVKSVALLRDPAAHFARGLAFVEFHSSEYAQYALQRTNGMALGGADMAVGGDNTVSVSFARVDVMQTLLKKVPNHNAILCAIAAFVNYWDTFLFQANQPGAALAVNPLVAQALQAAQWSANNGYSTVSPPAAAPPLPPQPYAYPNAIPAYAPYPDSVYPGAAAALEQQPYYAPAIPQVPRFPPNFEDNGGSYVFQSKSGYFLEPTTDFYYDPKNKRYLCGRDGSYYTYDAKCNPPFRPFYPPVPSAPYDPTPPATSPGVAAAAADQTAAVQAASQLVTAGVKVKLTSGAAAGKTGVGFGFGLSVNKKAKLDIAKWGALQQEEDEVPDATAASKSCVKTAQPEAAKKDDPMVVSAPPTVIAAVPALPAAPSPVQPTAAQAPPPPPPPAPPAAALPSVSTSVSTPAGPPVCLICQRQFPSVEVLRRHEKESKLHADNLMKLGVQQPQ
jgi:hypothetical protein